MEDLKNAIREMLKEEFTPVHARLDKLEGKVDKLSSQLDRMEHTQNEDLVATLHQMNKKTTALFERIDSHMRVLNDRLFTVEANLRLLQQS